MISYFFCNEVDVVYLSEKNCILYIWGIFQDSFLKTKCFTKLKWFLLTIFFLSGFVTEQTYFFKYTSASIERTCVGSGTWSQSTINNICKTWMNLESIYHYETHTQSNMLNVPDWDDVSVSSVCLLLSSISFMSTFSFFCCAADMSCF